MTDKQVKKKAGGRRGDAAASDKQNTDTELITGTISLHPKGFGFLDRDNTEAEPSSAFIPPPALRGFLAGDRVRAQLINEGRGRFRAEKLELRGRSRSRLFGEVVERRGRLYLRPDSRVANSDWWLLLAGQERPALGAAVVCGIEQDEKGRPQARLMRVVQPAMAMLERVTARHGLREGYPEVPEPSALPTDPGRRDLRALPTVTIDGPSTRDMDDALSVLPAGPRGGLRLLVHIADVDAWVPAGSPLDLEARARGTSVYLAGQVVPMLPRSLSEGWCSLVPGEDRLAMTVEMRIDPEGRITSCDVYRSLLRSDARLNYGDVARFLDRDELDAIPEPVHETLRWLRTALARLDIERRGRGGAELLREDARVMLDADDQPTGFVLRRGSSAHRLVERMMVAANEAVAGWLVERGLPGIFRQHPPPPVESVRMLAEAARHFGLEPGLGDVLSPLSVAALEAQFRDAPYAAAMRTVLQRALGPAFYSVEAGTHFGLASSNYLHFTSPIRRYADLAVHRVVKGFLSGERTLFAGDTELGRLAGQLDQAARRGRKAETDRMRMLAARHFTGRAGERASGHIVAVFRHGALVQLDGVGVAGHISTESLPGRWWTSPSSDALLSIAHRLPVGLKVQVRIEGADEAAGQIELTLDQALPAPPFAGLLDFWLGPLDEHGLSAPSKIPMWWKKDPALDAELKTRFDSLRTGLLAGRHRDWLATPLGTVAAIIALDQFSRNIGRDTPAMYEADALALDWSRRLIESGDIELLAPQEQMFAAMPLMHAEDLAAQEACVAFFERLCEHPDEVVAKGFENNLDFARQHRDIVARFGRFPHRNGILGRVSTPAEVEFLKQPGSGF